MEVIGGKVVKPNDAQASIQASTLGFQDGSSTVPMGTGTLPQVASTARTQASSSAPYTPAKGRVMGKGRSVAASVLRAMQNSKEAKDRIKDVETNGPRIAQEFFAFCDKAGVQDLDAQSEAIYRAQELRTMGLSIRQVATMAGRTDEQVKANALNHRYWQIAGAIIAGVSSPTVTTIETVKAEDGTEQATEVVKPVSWGEAVKTQSLRTMVKHIQDVTGKARKAEDPTAHCTRLFKLLCSKVAEHAVRYNVSDMLLEYLTSDSVDDALKLLKVNTLASVDDGTIEDRDDANWDAIVNGGKDETETEAEATDAADAAENEAEAGAPENETHEQLMERIGKQMQPVETTV